MASTSSSYRGSNTSMVSLLLTSGFQRGPFKFTYVIILMVVRCCNGLYRSTMFQIYLAQIGKQFHEAAPSDRYVIKE